MKFFGVLAFVLASTPLAQDDIHFDNPHDANSVMEQMQGMMAASRMKLSMVEAHHGKLVKKVRKKTDKFLAKEAESKLVSSLETARADLQKAENYTVNSTDWHDPIFDEKAKLEAQVESGERALKRAQHKRDTLVREAEEPLEEKTQDMSMKIGDLTDSSDKAKQAIEAPDEGGTFSAFFNTSHTGSGIHKKTHTSSFPIDVVYTWVPQPATAAEYQEVLQDCGYRLAGGLQRMRNLGTFRTSLRMIEQNMPWVRHIFVVSPNAAAPTWLNRQHPKITVVDQKDLFRFQSDLPIHNSQQVEVHLHRIPHLAEHFIYFNDDMMPGRFLQPSFFFSAEGKPILRTKRNLQHQANWHFLSQPGSERGEHTAYPLTISMINQMQVMWPTTFARISSAHCRGDIPHTQGPGWLYQWFGFQSDSSELSHAGLFAWLNNVNMHGASVWYQQQLHTRPDLLCINDDFETLNRQKFEHQIAELHSFLQTLSGGMASQFELDAKGGDHAVSVIATPCADEICIQLSAESV